MIKTCLDTEHSASIFHPWEEGFYLTCIGYVQRDGSKTVKEGVVWFDHRDQVATSDGIQKVQAMIDESDLLVFHNAKHDLNILRTFGLHVADSKLWCTMITDYLIEGQNKEYSYKLDAVAERYGLGNKFDEVKQQWDAGVDTFDIPDWMLAPYCVRDCQLTMDIQERQEPRVKEMDLDRVVLLQNEYTHTLSEMEYNGLLINTVVADKIVQHEAVEAEKYSELVLRGTGLEGRCNLSSPQQLSALLYGGLMKLTKEAWIIKTYKTQPYSDYKCKQVPDHFHFEGLGFEPDKKRIKQDGYYRVDKDTITGLPAKNNHQRELKRLLVEYSKHAKVVSTLQGRKGDKGLLAKVMLDGKLHPSLNQTIAATGRLTSSNPNGQNLPRGNTSPIKTCIVPTLDGIMQVDLSQIEWRDAAWLSQDPVMIQEINAGVDQHIATVKNLMEMEFISKTDKKSKENRDKAKVFNFRMIYGGTEWGFYLDIDMPNFSIKKWREIIKRFFDKYKALRKFHNKCIHLVYKNGYLKLPTGRWFKFNKKHLNDGSYGYAVNQIKNYPIQGMSGGDILPLMAVIIRRGMRKLGLRSKLVLTVHDSIVFDYAKDEKEKLAKLCYDVGNNLDKYIRSYYGIDWNVKLECEVECGPNYGAMKLLPYEEVA